ncbi:Hypothetical predicted protein [Podarcis lilfordi]|uniref:Uncharacterized protein n=1 Tax=Podarcis lilfordi TaxID=74358 RepID=A0AA35KWR2_9SAUR|nr:Hypothetical predicted protein [Podarcis lilfordi]
MMYFATQCAMQRNTSISPGTSHRWPAEAGEDAVTAYSVSCCGFCKEEAAKGCGGSFRRSSPTLRGPRKGGRQEFSKFLGAAAIQFRTRLAPLLLRAWLCITFPYSPPLNANFEPQEGLPEKVAASPHFHP